MGPSHRSSGSAVAALLVVLLGAVCTAVAQEDLVQRAREAKQAGEADRAINILEQGLADDPDNASAHYVLGWLYVGKGEEAKAAAAFRRVVELTPDTDEGREAQAALERMGASASPQPKQEESAGPTEDPGDLARLGPRPRMDGPTPTVTIDPVRTCPMIDGEPFFAIGCCGIPPEQMKTAAEAGFNLTIRWGWVGWCDAGYREALSVGTEAAEGYLRQYLSTAGEAGLYVMEFPLLFTEESLAYSDPDFHGHFERFMERRLPQVLDAIKDHPALFGYYGPEEFWEDPIIEAAARYSQEVRARDPQHLIYIVAPWGSMGGMDFERWQNWGADLGISGDDWYPLPDTRLFTPIASRAATHATWARTSQRAYWWLSLMYWAKEVQPYPLSPNAQRVQAYLALIGGANGIVWWMWPPRHIDQWRAIAQVNGEMQALEPVLLEPLAPARVEWEPAESSDTIQARAIRHDGRTFLLTANASADGATVGLRLPTTAPRARVWFEDRQVALVDGALADRFEGFDRHVYEIPDQWPDDRPLTIVVKRDPAPRAHGPWPGRGFDISGGNLLVDPGFEGDGTWQFLDWGRPLTCTGSLDTGNPLAGQRCAMVELLGEPSTPGYVGQPIELKPNTRYLFGTHMRTDVSSPCNVVGALRSTEPSELLPTTLLRAHPNSPWSRYSALFATNDEPVRVRPEVGHDQGLGVAWFDDLFLYEACPGIGNLVANGGFEGPEVAKGWPINWCELYSLEIPGHIGSDDPLWGVDHGTAYEGTNSLRMVHPGDARKGGKPCPRACQYLVPGLVVKKDQPFVFSANMKADRPNLLVQVHGGVYHEGPDREVRVGTEWERYVLPTASTHEERLPFVAVALLQEGTLWIDAVQFERGTEPTDYQEWWY